MGEMQAALARRQASSPSPSPSGAGGGGGVSIFPSSVGPGPHEQGVPVDLERAFGVKCLISRARLA